MKKTFAFRKIFLSLLIVLSPLATSLAIDGDTQNKLVNDIVQNNETEETYIFKKSYNPIYQFINNYEYLLAPLSAAIAGGVRCGLKCAAVGGILGVIDEAAIYLGFVDKHYLTWGVFGITTGHVIKPSITSDIAGVAVGVLLPTGILNDHKEMVAPVVSAVAGGSVGGIWGAINGMAAGAIDETAIQSDITDKHYMTFSTIGMTATNLLGLFNPAVANFIGVILGSVAAEYEETITASLQAPIKTTKNLYTTYDKFIPKDQLNARLEKHALALVSSQLMIQWLTLKSIGHRQSIAYNFEHLDNRNSPTWGALKSEFINFAIFLFPYVIARGASSYIDDYFCKKLQFDLEDKIKSELFFGETALRLSPDRNTTVALDNLEKDISTITASGSGLVTDAVSSVIEGSFGVGIVVVSSPDIAIYQALYNQAQFLISSYLANQQEFYKEKTTTLNSELVSVMKHDIENIRTITERDGIKFTEIKLQQLHELLREHEINQKLWGSTANLWDKLSGFFDFIFNYFLVAQKVNQGTVPFEDRFKVRIASWQVSDVLSWPTRNAQSIAEIDTSLNRIFVLEGKMHAPSSNIDKINRIIQEGNQLTFRDLEVGMADRMLVTVNNLKLEMGKTYAITGNSGCGKTSFLSKIKGVKENGVFGKGNIYYPLINGKNPKIVMLSQQDYFPLRSTLYEIISYPNIIPSDPEINTKKRQEIRLLLDEIGLDAFSKTADALSLDSIKDWGTYLSGGEKKKIIIVSAVVKKPNILLLDEIFNGLDQKSIIAVQQMLKKYLPNTLMLVVDHHTQNNNYNFYDGELNFVDKSITLKEIISK